MTAKKIIRWVLVVIWIVFVIFLSCQTGDASNSLSHIIAARFFGITTESFNCALRTCAHFGTHFILVILLYIAFSDDDSPEVSAFIVGTVIAVCDEIVQTFIPGRNLEFTDFIVNLVGVGFGVVICIIFAHRKKPLTL